MTRSEARRVFGRRLQESRLARGKTQKATAAESRIPLPTYQGYEQGRSFPTAERLADLCRVLDTRPDALIPHDWTRNHA
jgi:transcriptional regulator with XRE-family HTH domain